MPQLGAHKPHLFHSSTLQTVNISVVCCSHHSKNREKRTAGKQYASPIRKFFTQSKTEEQHPMFQAYSSLF